MSAARPARGAVDAFLADLQKVVGCITQQQLWVAADRYDTSLVHTVAFGRRAEPVALGGVAGPSGLLFDLSHQYRIVEDTPTDHRPTWRITTAAYEYRLLDHDQEELLVFHWQPGAPARGPDHPHVHVSATLRGKRSATTAVAFPLDKRHIPTGRVSLEAVIRELIEEFEVSPRYPTWMKRLAETEARFRRQRRRDDW